MFAPRGHVGITNPDDKPSDDEGLRIVRDDKPRPRLFQEDISDPEHETVAGPATEAPRFFSLKRIAITVGIIVALVIVAFGITYWNGLHRFPVVVTIGLPDNSAQGDPLAGKRGALVPVKPDMLHVTSISLGDPRLTIVNEKRLAEGEWVVVDTPLGAASLRVISIQDGLVRFRHGGESIDVKLQAVQQTKR